MGFKENLAQLTETEAIQSITIYRKGELVRVIPNIPGKQGSVRVYANILGFEDGNITSGDARRGLEIFDELVDESRRNPGKHPNIDTLLEVVE